MPATLIARDGTTKDIADGENFDDLGDWALRAIQVMTNRSLILAIDTAARGAKYWAYADGTMVTYDLEEFSEQTRSLRWI
jgi:hypothetical protein